MDQEPQTKQPDEMYCSSCAALIKSGVQFCPQCGARVGSTSEATSLSTAHPKPWYKRWWAAIAALILFWPLGIALLLAYHRPNLRSFWERRDRRPIARRLTDFARAHTLAFAGLLLWFVVGLFVLAMAIWLQIQIEQETDLILEISRQFREQGRDFEALEVLVNYEERDNSLIVPAAIWVLVNIAVGIGLGLRMAGFGRKKRGGDIQENGPPN